jgi:hypothetical protein
MQPRSLALQCAVTFDLGASSVSADCVHRVSEFEKLVELATYHPMDWRNLSEDVGSWLNTLMKGWKEWGLSQYYAAKIGNKAAV